MWSASRVELPEHVAEVQHSVFGIFDWVSENEEESRDGKEAGQPLPSIIECNVGTAATAELRLALSWPTIHMYACLRTIQIS